MNTSELLVQCLEQEGVEYVLGVPGEENLDFLEALKDSSITLVPTRHEQSAGFMAATIGRLTGKTGVCLSTLGPGATNFTTAAAYAQLGGMPMMMITGQKPILKSKQGHFQIIDVVKMMEPLTKFSKQITHGDRIAHITREAFRQAQSERPGAVHIELPEDIAAETVTNKPLPVSEPRRPDANIKAVAQAVKLIENSKHPLVVIGAGANRKQVAKMLKLLIDKTGIHFVTTQMGKGVIDERHERYIGCAALSSNDYVHCAIDKADLIINIGHDIIEKPPFFMEADGKTVIHINFSAAEIDEVYFPQHEVVGDVANALWQIQEQITVQDHWNFSTFNNVSIQLKEHLQELSDSDSFPIKPQRYVADIRKVMGDEDIVTLDNGMYKLWFARNYPAYKGNTILLDNALATMGAGLPSAMAAKLIYPEKRVMAVCGDGGFMMNSQELETALRLNLDLVVVILNNSNYGMIKWKQSAMGFADFGLDFGNPDFVKYAESYGAHGHRIQKTEDFLPTLEAAFNAGGVHIIDVPIDDSEHERVLTKQLAQKTCVL